MEERIRMLVDYDTGNWSVSELCARYGVCRDTFYAWRKRRESGARELVYGPLACSVALFARDRSRAQR